MTTVIPKPQISEEILNKHAVGIQAARNYYVLNIPTGMSDHDYDVLEALAFEDGLSLRDYVRQEIQGTRTQNADYITKVEKTQVDGDMFDSLCDFLQNNPEVEYVIPKYDGSSLAAYYDTSTGECMRVVTVGGSNLGGEGIDQTYKFARFFPNLKGTGIKALQCECLVALEHGFGESSRQKANGLVNSAFKPLPLDIWLSNSTTERTEKGYQKYLTDFEVNKNAMEAEVANYINIRCFRYYIEGDTQYDYQKTLQEIPSSIDLKGDIKFSGGFVLSKDDILGSTQYKDLINTDIWQTPTGRFLVDGVVCYTATGTCVKALKYKDAGRGETVEVDHIQWNNQASKGKDSWSANAVLSQPVLVRGSKITKPTVGSVKKMVETKLSKGARVNVILANSTIPQVKEVLEPGNGNYEWPTCGCGYQMSEKDVFGSLLKCGNPMCSDRISRMRRYLQGIQKFGDIDLDKLLILDRFKWSAKANLSIVLPDILQIVYTNLGEQKLGEYLAKYMTTDLQRRNLQLVIGPAYLTLSEYISQHYDQANP